MDTTARSSSCRTHAGRNSKRGTRGGRQGVFPSARYAHPALLRPDQLEEEYPSHSGKLRHAQKQRTVVYARSGRAGSGRARDPGEGRYAGPGAYTRFTGHITDETYLYGLYQTPICSSSLRFTIPRAWSYAKRRDGDAERGRARQRDRRADHGRRKRFLMRGHDGKPLQRAPTRARRSRVHAEDRQNRADNHLLSWDESPPARWSVTRH